MKIIKLTAENVKRLKAIEITPNGNLVVIGGMNEQGKSSTIDSIAMAFGGKKHIPPQPVRRGAKKATIVCETEDLIVTRTMTPEGGGTLKVGTRDGKVYQSPQSILDAMTGQLTFDPLAFSNMEDRAQLNTLKKLVGLDFSDLEQKRTGLYDERTEINRKGKRLVGELAGLPEFPNAPTKEVSVADLMGELEKQQAHNVKIVNKKMALENDQIATAAQSNHIQEIGKQIEALKIQLSNLQQEKINLELSLKDRNKTEAKKEKEIQGMVEADTQKITVQISSAEETNRQVRANQEKVKLNKEIEKLRVEKQAFTDKINEIDEQKTAQLSQAKFPIDGLSFNEDGVLFNDLPFSQAASSQRLKISTAMGFAMNPDLRVLLIKDGSLLDDGNLKLMAEMAEKEDAQIWMERVGEGQEVSVIIEDGNIKQEAV